VNGPCVLTHHSAFFFRVQGVKKKVILPGLLDPKNEYTITLQNTGTTHPVSQHYIAQNLKLHLQHLTALKLPF
jgi:hypothetical protein